jgi:hypothetical protein
MYTCMEPPVVIVGMKEKNIENFLTHYLSHFVKKYKVTLLSSSKFPTPILL